MNNNEINTTPDNKDNFSNADQDHTPWFQKGKDWRPDPTHNHRQNSIW